MQRTLAFGLLAIAVPATLSLALQDPPQTSAVQDSLPTIEDGQALLDSGDPSGAAAIFKRIKDAQPQNGQAHFMFGYSAHMAGDLDTAHDAHIAAAAFPQFAALAHYNHACIHSLRGERDIAFNAIASAREAGFDRLDILGTDTDMDNLRADARFGQLLLDLQPAGTHEGVALTDLANLPDERRFDFLIGDWDVTASGADAPEAVIGVTRAFEGRGVKSSSRSTETGGTRSEATYMHTDEGWRMYWIGQDGQAAMLQGGLEGDGMVMTLVAATANEDAEGRATFTNIGSDGFDYTWEAPDGAGGWASAASLRYSRR